MGFLSGLAGGAFSGLFTNATNSLNAFHDFENDFGPAKFIDPAGVAIGGINQRAAKKQNAAQLSFANSLANMEAALTYAYQKQSALEMPKLIRQGYEDAGYNALLALGSTGGATSAVRASLPSHGASEIAPRGNAQINPLMFEAMQTAQAQREEIKEKTKSIKFDRKLRLFDLLLDGAKTVGTVIAARHLAKNYKGAVTHSAKSARDLSTRVIQRNGMHGIPESKAPWNKFDAKSLLPVVGTSSGIAGAALGYVGLQYALGKLVEDEQRDSKIKGPNPNAARGRGMYVTPPKRPTSKRKHN